MLQQALSVAAEAFTVGTRLQNPLALRLDYNAKLSAPFGIEGLQPRSPNSVALTARIALNFGAQNQAWAWVLAIPLTGRTWWSDLNARAVGKGRLWGMKSGSGRQC